MTAPTPSAQLSSVRSGFFSACSARYACSSARSGAAGETGSFMTIPARRRSLLFRDDGQIDIRLVVRVVRLVPRIVADEHVVPRFDRLGVRAVAPRRQDA